MMTNNCSGIWKRERHKMWVRKGRLCSTLSKVSTVDHMGDINILMRSSRCVVLKVPGETGLGRRRRMDEDIGK